MVSVIIPVYNREKTIKRAAESVLNQTVTDLELIIVDDCSTDETRRVVQEIEDKRLKYVKLETNQGACAARNTGISHANGSYIAFQDSDDFWKKDKLEYQLNCMKEYGGDVCFCAMERHNYPSHIDKIFPCLPRGMVEFNTIASKSYVSTQTVIAKKEVFSQIRFDKELKRMQDFDWAIRAAQKYVFVYENKPLVDVYLQDDSISRFDERGSRLIKDASYILLNKYEKMVENCPTLKAYLIEQIAMNKIMLDEDAKKDLWQLFSIKKSAKNLAKAMLVQMGFQGLLKK